MSDDDSSSEECHLDELGEEIAPLDIMNHYFDQRCYSNSPTPMNFINELDENSEHISPLDSHHNVFDCRYRSNSLPTHLLYEYKSPIINIDHCEKEPLEGLRKLSLDSVSEWVHENNDIPLHKPAALKATHPSHLMIDANHSNWGFPYRFNKRNNDCDNVSETSDSASSDATKPYVFRPIHSNDRLSPTISSVGAVSPSSTRSLSPSSCYSISPTPRRRRSTTVVSISSIPEAVSPTRIPRDPIQPNHGSISELIDKIHSAEDDEELDDFLENNFCDMRRCSSESRELNRKARLKIANRPPTPPPFAVTKQRTVLNDKLIPEKVLKLGCC